VQEKKIDKFGEDNNKSGGINYPWYIYRKSRDALWGSI
jgi:hypothetical protein